LQVQLHKEQEGEEDWRNDEHLRLGTSEMDGTEFFEHIFYLFIYLNIYFVINILNIESINNSTTNIIYPPSSLIKC
jgi:hypothetical protein